MSTPLTLLSSKDVRARVLLAATFVAALAMCWFGVRWQIGSMFAELTAPGDPSAREVAPLARSLSPADPLASWLAAGSERSVFTPEHLELAVGLYEDVVRLAPNDYRWWIELGRAREQAERFEAAENAFRHAVHIAPSYAFPHWQLGNFYLRRNRPDEAFTELRKTTENNLTYRDQVFSLGWEYFDHDPAKLEQIVPDSPDVRAGLSLFYAAREQAADSLRIWNTLSDEQKARHPQTAVTIAQALTDKRFFLQAVEFSRQTGVDPEAEAETVTNGGFEKFIGPAEETHFGWKLVRGDSKIDMSVDSSVKHSGARSLKVAFKSYVKAELNNVWQIVAVQPLRNYRLSFWLRTESLKSAGVPLVEVVNGNSNLLLASSAPFSTGTADWQEFNVDFTTPADCEGIVIRTSRSFCGEACPINGIIWYDDFSLNKR